MENNLYVLILIDLLYLLYFNILFSLQYKTEQA